MTFSFFLMWTNCRLIISTFFSAKFLRDTKTQHTFSITIVIEFRHEYLSFSANRFFFIKVIISTNHGCSHLTFIIKLLKRGCTYYDTLDKLPKKPPHTYTRRKSNIWNQWNVCEVSIRIYHLSILHFSLRHIEICSDNIKSMILFVTLFFSFLFFFFFFFFFVSLACSCNDWNRTNFLSYPIYSVDSGPKCD